MYRLTSRQFHCALLSLFASLTGAGLEQCLADDWPQFRGPNCTGLAESTRPLPTTFSSTVNVKWSVPLGDGIGCPTIASGRVFVSAMNRDDKVSLLAFDAAN